MYRQVLLYVISFCLISLKHGLKIYTTFQIYAIIFGLTHFCLHDMWPLLSFVGGGLQEVMSLSHSVMCVDYVSDTVTQLM